MFALFLALLLKSIDRQLLGLFKPMLDTEFGWSTQDYGRLTAALQLAGALSLPIAGRIVDSIPLRWCMAAAVLGWSALTIGQGLSVTLGTFVMLRIGLSVAESVGNPAALRFAADQVGGHLRYTAVASINLAASIGAIAAPLLVALLAAPLGWRGTSVLAGSLGLAWTAWWLSLPNIGRQHQSVAPPLAWLPALPLPAAMLIAAKALTDQFWWVSLYWLPDFLSQNLAEGQVSVWWGGSLAAVFASGALGSLIAPRLMQRFPRAGLAGAALAVTALPIAALSHHTTLAIPCLAMACHQIVSTRIFHEICDERFVGLTGTLGGAGAFTSNLVAVGTLLLAGRWLGSDGGYLWLFSLVSAAYLVGTSLLMLHNRK